MDRRRAVRQHEADRRYERGSRRGAGAPSWRRCPTPV